jgi:hypothetical protein
LTPFSYYSDHLPRQRTENSFTGQFQTPTLYCFAQQLVISINLGLFHPI